MQFVPSLYSTISPMVNRNGIQSFVLFVPALFSQQSQFPVRTKRLNMQRLNNLSWGESENIHFTATWESVYLRLQRQTLERGEERLKKNHNNFLQETKEETWKWNTMECAFPRCQHLILTLGGCVWVFYLSCLTRLSRRNQATSPLIFSLCLLYLYLFFIFILFG